MPEIEARSAAGHRWFSRPLWVHFVAAPSFVAIVTAPLWWPHV